MFRCTRGSIFLSATNSPSILVPNMSLSIPTSPSPLRPPSTHLKHVQTSNHIPLLQMLTFFNASHPVPLSISFAYPVALPLQVRKAEKFGTKIVSLDFMEKSIERGSLVDHAPFLLVPPPASATERDNGEDDE